MRVQWLFYDAEGTLLTDGTNVYILRRDDVEGWLAYACVPVDDAEKLQALAQAKGVTFNIPGPDAT